MLKNIANRKTNIRVVVICKLTDPLFIGKIVPIISIDGVKCIYVFRKGGGPKLPKVTYMDYNSKKPFRSLIRIFQFLKGEHIDFIISFHWTPHGIIASLLGLFTGIRTIPCLIGSTRELIRGGVFFKKFPRIVGLIMKWFYIRLLLKAYYVGTTGTNTSSYLLKFGIQRTARLTSTLERVYPIIPYDKKQFDVIFVGRFVSVKRIDWIVDIIRDLDIHMNINAIFVGDGPDWNHINSQIKEEGLDNKINLVGWSDNVHHYLDMSRVLVLASESEGLAFVSIEAMAHGLPCVTTNVGDLSDLIDHGKNGFLVRDGDEIRQFKIYLEKLLTDIDLYRKMSVQARDKVEEGYTYKSAEQIWNNLLFSHFEG